MKLIAIRGRVIDAALRAPAVDVHHHERRRVFARRAALHFDFQAGVDVIVSEPARDADEPGSRVRDTSRRAQARWLQSEVASALLEAARSAAVPSACARSRPCLMTLAAQSTAMSAKEQCAPATPRAPARGHARFHGRSPVAL